MPRLTITLSDEMHRALKEAAVRRGKSIRQIIEDSLEENGIKTTESAAAIVARVRERSRLSGKDAIDLALGATSAQREK